MGDASTDEKVIGVAVIGIGRIGKVHVANILRMPRVELLYIIDVCKDLAQKYVEEFGLGTKALHTDNIDVALDDQKVHAVIICCPSLMHEHHTKAALIKGKAVMCEKPLSLSIDAIVECYQLAEDEQKPLFCAFNRRFDPQIAAIKSQIPNVVGKLKVVKCVSRDYPMNSFEYLKISGGFMLDSAVHDVDVMKWIAGEVPETVYAIGHAHYREVAEFGDVDQLFVTLKFASGLMAHADMCREARYGHDQRMEVFGDKGMITSNNQRSTSNEIHVQTGSQLPPIHQSCMARYNEAYRHEMAHFLDAVRGKSKLKVSGKETVWTTLCCLAANESLSTGNPVNVMDFVTKRHPTILEAMKGWNE